MRLLHTADWHLGRPFHGASLLDHQAEFLSWLAELATTEQVDAVLVAGDVYDRSLPPGEAVALASDGFAQLAAAGREVLVIPGNHDSAQRLAFAAPLLARAGLHLLTDPERCGEPVHIGPAAIYGIPYLEPELAAPRLGCAERGHGAVLGAAMARVRAAHSAAGSERACVVMAHAFVAGGAPTASERELAVGGAAQVAAGTFAGADYVALGHLHRSQATVAGRYSGSPLAFSFSEAADVKSVTIAELDGPGRVRTRTVPCPVPRALTRVRGPLEELLADPGLSAHEDDWIEATLTDAARPLDAMARLQTRFPHAVSLVFEPLGAVDGAASTYASRLRGLTEEEVLDRFVLDVRGTPGEASELVLLGEALAAGRAIRLERQRH